MRRHKISKMENTMVVVATTIMCCLIALSTSITVDAKEIKENVSGDYYEFEKSSKYEISESTAGGKVSSVGSYGLFSITGNIKAIADVNGIPAYEVQDANVQIA